MQNKTKKRNELRNKLFSKFFQNKEGIPAGILCSKISFITRKYDDINKLIAKEDEDFTSYQNVKFIKKVKLNNKEYLFICTDTFKFIVIDINNKITLNTSEVYEIFNDDFFRKNIDEHGLSEFYNFVPSKYINEILEIYNNNEFLFTLPTHLIYEVNIGEVTSSLIINTNCEKGMLFFDTPNHFLYEQLFLGKDLKPTSMSSSTLDYEKGFEIASKVKDIVIPYDVIPEELLRAINGYELANAINNLKIKLRNEINEEAMKNFGKKFVDLTPNEIEKSSVKIRREYRKTSNKLFWSMAKYTDCGVIHTDGSINAFYEKYKEFKEAYYKKHPSEKK